MARASRPEPAVLLAVGLGLLLVSSIAPHDRLTWVLEVAPILIAVAGAGAHVPPLSADAARLSA